MNLQPVLLSLHLNLLQSAGWSQRHHHCTHTLFFTGSGNSTWAIKLSSKAFFYCQALPPAHVRACVKISPRISFTPSPFISSFKYYITIHTCYVLFICSFAYWRLFVPLDYWEWCCCGHWFTKMVYTRTHAAIIRYKEWMDKFISIHLRQVNYYVKKNTKMTHLNEKNRKYLKKLIQ